MIVAPQRLDEQERARLAARREAWDACVDAFMTAWRGGKIRLTGCPHLSPRVDLPFGGVTLRWQRSTATERGTRTQVFAIRVHCVAKPAKPVAAIEPAEPDNPVVAPLIEALRLEFPPHGDTNLPHKEVVKLLMKRDPNLKFSMKSLGRAFKAIRGKK